MPSFGPISSAPISSPDSSECLLRETILLTDLSDVDYVVPIYEVFVATDIITLDKLMAIISYANARDSVSTLATLVMLINDSVAAREYFTFLFDRTIADGFAATDLNTTNVTALLAIVDQLRLTDSTITTYDGIILVVSAIVLGDTLGQAIEQGVVDTFAMADLIASAREYIQTIVDALALTDLISNSAVMTAFIASNAAVADSTSGQLTLFMSLLDTTQVMARFNLPNGDVYAGYTVNISNAAVTETTNFPFNSFANMGSVVLAAGEDGIYALGGNDDAGTKIAASVRLGLTDFGTSQLKKVPNALIGYTSTGQLVLKVTTTDGGAKQENWYTMKARSAISPVEGRLDIAKGLTARYWGWELANIDGANFELESLKVWPMVLQRRKSGR